VTDEQRHEQGITTRRAVLGDAHVDRAVANTTEFTAPFQDFITRYAWARCGRGRASTAARAASSRSPR
jgi:alkylhydroperoxidase/carboxymuconolactone decarboxylase family protein YurZ